MGTGTKCDPPNIYIYVNTFNKCYVKAYMIHYYIMIENGGNKPQPQENATTGIYKIRPLQGAAIAMQTMF